MAIDDSIDDPWARILADIDADGLADIVIDGDLGVVMGGLIWYENPLPVTSPAGKPWIAHRVAEHKTHDIEGVDLDKDGDSEMAMRGTLTFILWGPMPVSAERAFHVCFDFRPQVRMTDIEPRTSMSMTLSITRGSRASRSARRRPPTTTTSTGRASPPSRTATAMTGSPTTLGMHR